MKQLSVNQNQAGRKVRCFVSRETINKEITDRFQEKSRKEEKREINQVTDRMNRSRKGSGKERKKTGLIRQNADKKEKIAVYTRIEKRKQQMRKDEENTTYSIRKIK